MIRYDMIGYDVITTADVLAYIRERTRKEREKNRVRE